MEIDWAFAIIITCRQALDIHPWADCSGTRQSSRGWSHRPSSCCTSPSSGSYPKFQASQKSFDFSCNFLFYKRQQISCVTSRFYRHSGKQLTYFTNVESFLNRFIVCPYVGEDVVGVLQEMKNACCMIFKSFVDDSAGDIDRQTDRQIHRCTYPTPVLFPFSRRSDELQSRVFIEELPSPV